MYCKQWSIHCHHLSKHVTSVEFIVEHIVSLELKTRFEQSVGVKKT